ncbi:unnamed protein product [Auanema sp. JU1783]|nr:unnamed protein product [Auanema sp. JU1783]
MDLIEELPCWGVAVKDPLHYSKMLHHNMSLDIPTPEIVPSSVALSKLDGSAKIGTITEATTGPYQKVLDWGRQEHYFKLANIFHTNNY